MEENADLQVEIMLSQIQPHFLFNTLAAIGRLCRNDPEAKEAVNKFARYLRGNMDSLSHQEHRMKQRLHTQWMKEHPRFCNYL